MKKQKFGKRPRLSDEMSLQITSMADIFTILLVFLLKSYSTSALTPAHGVTLPDALLTDATVEALKMQISKTGVEVEGELVVPLVDYQAAAGEIQADGSLKSLTAALEKQRKRQLLIAKQNSDVKVDPRIIVAADQKVPYETVKHALASAALQGYTDFKLAVAKGD